MSAGTSPSKSALKESFSRYQTAADESNVSVSSTNSTYPDRRNPFLDNRSVSDSAEISLVVDMGSDNSIICESWILSVRNLERISFGIFPIRKQQLPR